MKILVTIALTTISVLSFSQTDIIEMRSRNASLKEYNRTLEKSSYDHIVSNFGMAPMPEVKTAVLDSVKAISDSVAIMYTSNYCSRGYNPTLDVQFYFDSNGVQQRLEKPARTYPNPRIGHLWQPGADTVRNHPLFSNRHSLDSVKEVIDRSYHFNLPSDSIEFIGFDNMQGQLNVDPIQPVKHKHKRKKKKNSFGWELIFMLVTPVLLVLGMSKHVFPKISN